MSDARLGHYGLPAIVFGAAAVLALLLHLLVPYAHVNPEEEGADSFVLDRGEAADFHDDADLVVASSPGLTLTGTILLAVAGLGLVVCSFVPLTVTPARWLGWSLCALGSAGGLMTFSSSMLWVGSGVGLAPASLYGGSNSFFGDGFGGMGLSDQTMILIMGGVTGGLTGILEMVLQTDNAARAVIISPVLVAGLAATALLACVSIAAKVVSLENGYRERAQQHLAGAKWALLFLALVAIVPWSIGKIEDYEGQGDTDYFVFGAHTVLNADKASDGDVYSGLAYTMNVLLAVGWVGFAFSYLGSLGGVLASVGAPPVTARMTHFAIFGTAFMLLWGFIAYVLAWSFQWKPESGSDGFQPGYFPVLLLPVLVFWILRLLAIGKTLMKARATGKEAGMPKPVRFD